MSNEIIKESVGGGTTGTGGIAVRTDGPGISSKQQQSLQQFLRKFSNRVANKYNYHKVETPFPITVNEAFDIQDVLSRLRGIEGKKISPTDNATYGVEDDKGNVMKITVRKDQAPEFETVLAHELAAIDSFSVTGNAGKEVSMAELLFNLKDKFDIIDVDFPKIPTDVVYNADQATYNVNDKSPANDMVSDDQTNLDNAGMGETDDLGDISDPNAPFDLSTMGDEGTEAPADELDVLDEPEGDAEGVEEFVEPTESSEGSILDRVLDMLKAQAEAQTAQANAEAEKYRADQAEYSARAAQATVAQQEELARMELEMDKQKDQEKQAKKLADIARFRVQQASGIKESDSGETAQMVRRMMQQLPMKWQVQPNDDAETRSYKQRQMANEMRELQARMRTARLRDQRRKELQTKDSQNQRDQNRNDQNQNQNNQQQPNQGNNQTDVDR